MPKYKVIATEYIFKDAFMEADTEEEACLEAEDRGDWVIVGGDWKVHEAFEEKEGD